MLLAVHYSQPPDWRWYILGYFFLAGLAGGTYTLGTLLRLWGRASDEQAARLCFLLALPLTVLCPVFLSVDLGQPARFWHMLWDSGVGGPGINFRYWSPMSLGASALLLFGVFAALSFLDAVARDGRYRYPLSGVVAAVMGGPVGTVLNVVGMVFGLFIAAYTGVLLDVSNQPVWSDTWALGGLFLASGLSGAAALITIATRWRPAAAASQEAVTEADAYFVLLELGFLALVFATLAVTGQLTTALAMPWLILWVVAILTALLPLAERFRGGLVMVGPGGAATLTRVGISSGLAALIVLVGVVALRAAVLWSAQA